MSNDLILDFVFVSNGAPWPADWVRRHPDYITLPARFKGMPEQMCRMFGNYRPVPAQTFFQKAQRSISRIGDGGAESTKEESTADKIATNQGEKASEATRYPSSAIAGVVSAWTGGAVQEYPDALPKIEPQSVRDSVIKALDLIEPGVDHLNNVRSFGKEFAQIVDPTMLNWTGWEESWSPHTKFDPGAKPPLERRTTSFPDYVAKFYPDDTNGPNMAVVTRRTFEPMHWVEAFMWNLGYFSNAILSHEFCVAAAGCGPYSPAVSSKK